MEGTAGLAVGRWTVRSLVLEGSIAAGCLGRARAVEAVFEGGFVSDVVEAFGGDVEPGPGSARVEIFVGDVVETFGVDVERELELTVVTIGDFMGDVVKTLTGDEVEGSRSAVIVVVVVATAGTVVAIVLSSSSSQSISSSIATAAALVNGLVSIVVVVVVVMGLVEVGEIMEDCFSSDSWRRATRSAFLPVWGRERDLSSSSSSAFFFLL